MCARFAGERRKKCTCACVRTPQKRTDTKRIIKIWPLVSIVSVGKGENLYVKIKEREILVNCGGPCLGNSPPKKSGYLSCFIRKFQKKNSWRKRETLFCSFIMIPRFRPKIGISEHATSIMQKVKEKEYWETLRKLKMQYPNLEMDTWKARCLEKMCGDIIQAHNYLRIVKLFRRIYVWKTIFCITSATKWHCQKWKFLSSKHYNDLRTLSFLNSSLLLPASNAQKKSYL